MNETLKKVLTYGGIVLVIILIITFMNRGKFGSTAIPSQQNAESGTNSSFASESIATIGTFFLGGHNSDTLPIANYATVGNCTRATSTVVSVQNPFSATSSVQLIAFTGSNGTSTIKFLAGTSTVASVSGIQPSITLLNTGNIATSTGFYISGNATAGPSGFVSPGTSNFGSIVVAPSEYVVVQATSTSGLSADNAAITQTGSTFSCTYKLLWTK